MRSCKWKVQPSAGTSCSYNVSSRVPSLPSWVILWIHWRTRDCVPGGWRGESHSDGAWCCHRGHSGPNPCCILILTNLLLFLNSVMVCVCGEQNQTIQEHLEKILKIPFNSSPISFTSPGITSETFPGCLSRHFTRDLKHVSSDVQTFSPMLHMLFYLNVRITFTRKIKHSLNRGEEWVLLS